jgi:S1-C subfamily serine protease
MRSLAVAALVALVSVCGLAQADDHGMLDAKSLVRKVRRGVLKVQVADIRTGTADTDWGGGSGFIFEVDYDQGIAYAITNHHVAGHASSVSATLWNGNVYNGELVRSEPGIDIALIRLHGIPDERNLPDDQKTIVPVVLGDSDKVQIGEAAMAMGSPGAQDRATMFGGADRSSPYDDFLMMQTATLNVVTGRESPLDFAMQEWEAGRSGGGDEHETMGYQYATNLEYTFRMSTAINGGNSGGPLFNKDGEVIGINTWGGADAIMQNGNLSVPINMAKDFVYQILNTGKFEKPWLGLDVIFPPYINKTDTYVEFRERQRPERLEIYSVRHDSPADKAGIKRGDIVMDINGQKFKTPEELRLWMFKQDIGAPLVIRLMRGGRVLADPVKVNVGVKRSYDAEFSV